MASKAIGLRIPAPLWEQVSEFGRENFPKPDSDKDFDITATLLELIGKGLGNDGVKQPDIQDVEQSIENIVNEHLEQVVLRKLDSLLEKEEFLKLVLEKPAA